MMLLYLIWLLFYLGIKTSKSGNNSFTETPINSCIEDEEDKIPSSLEKRLNIKYSETSPSVVSKRRSMHFYFI